MIRSIVCALILLTPIGSAIAQNKRLGSLPISPKKVGFVAHILVETAPTKGYLPVTIDVKTLAGPSPITRNLQVIIGARASNLLNLSFDCYEDLELPQGAGAVSIVCYVPQHRNWTHLNVRILEDGRLITGGKKTFPLQIRNRTGFDGRSVGIVLPHDASTQNANWKKFPDVRTLSATIAYGVLPEEADIARLNHQQAFLAVDAQISTVRFRIVEETRLYPSWIGYSQLDVVLVPGAVWKRIAREQKKALIDWVVAGGQLWIYAAGTTTNALLANLINADNGVIPVANKSDWKQKLDLKTFEPDFQDSLCYNTGTGMPRNSRSKPQSRLAILKSLQKANHPFADTESVASMLQQCKQYSVGLGRITTIAEEDPFPGSFLFWSTILQEDETPSKNYTWQPSEIYYAHHESYWSFLLKSVGQPPIKTFLLLNTLFVIGVGPVCYFFFRRQGHLHRLLFVAPAAAIIVTMGLFAYAMVADGFQTRWQIQSITWLDARNDRTLTQSRETYYAGMKNRIGLGFPLDALALPVQPIPPGDSNGPPSQNGLGTITCDANTRRFADAFFPARQQVQFVTTRPAKLTKSIDFHFRNEQSVTNHLPCVIKQLLIHDHSKRMWRTDRINIGQKKKLNQMQLDLKAASEIFTMPFEVQPIPDTFRIYGRTISQQGSPGFSYGLPQLESKMKRWKIRMPAGTFVAEIEPIQSFSRGQELSTMGEYHILMGELP